jgi:myosin heavy subunit
MEIKIKTAAEFHDSHVRIEIVVDGQAEVEEVHRRLYTAAEVGQAQVSEAELVAAPLRRRIAELERELASADQGAGRRIAELQARLAESADVATQPVRTWGDLRENPDRMIVDWSGDQEARVRELEAELARVRTEMEAQDEDHRELYAALQAKLREQVQSIQARDRLLAAATEEASQVHQRVIELEAELEAQRERADDNRAWAERAEARLAARAMDLGATQHDLEEAHKEIERRKDQLGRISSAVHGPSIHRALQTLWERSDTRAMAEAIRQVQDALLPETRDELTSQA